MTLQVRHATAGSPGPATGNPIRRAQAQDHPPSSSTLGWHKISPVRTNTLPYGIRPAVDNHERRRQDRQAVDGLGSAVDSQLSRATPSRRLRPPTGVEPACHVPGFSRGGSGLPYAASALPHRSIPPAAQVHKPSPAVHCLCRPRRVRAPVRRRWRFGRH